MYVCIVYLWSIYVYFIYVHLCIFYLWLLPSALDLGVDGIYIAGTLINSLSLVHLCILYLWSIYVYFICGYCPVHQTWVWMVFTVEARLLIFYPWSIYVYFISGPSMVHLCLFHLWLLPSALDLGVVWYLQCWHVYFCSDDITMYNAMVNAVYQVYRVNLIYDIIYEIKNSKRWREKK